MNKNKCLEYYLDSKIYGSKEIQESIENTKKEYLNKKVNVNILLNDYGMYVITFYFENKNNFFNKIKIWFKKKNKKVLLLEENNIKKEKIKNTKSRLEKHYQENHYYKPY